MSLNSTSEEKKNELIIPTIPGIVNIIGTQLFHYFRTTVVFEESVDEFVFAVPAEFIEYFQPNSLLDESKIGRILKNKFIDRYQQNNFERVAYYQKIEYKELDEELLNESVELIVLYALDFPEGIDLILDDNSTPSENTDTVLIQQAFTAVMSDSPETFKELIKEIHPQNFYKMIDFIPYSDDDFPFARAVFEQENSIAFDHYTFEPIPVLEEDEENTPELVKKLQDIERENIKRFILRVLKYAIYFTEYEIALKIIKRFSKEKKNLPYLEYFLNYMYDSIGIGVEKYLPEEVEILELLNEKIANMNS